MTMHRAASWVCPNLNLYVFAAYCLFKFCNVDYLQYFDIVRGCHEFMATIWIPWPRLFVEIEDQNKLPKIVGYSNTSQFFTIYSRLNQFPEITESETEGNRSRENQN